MPQLKTGRHVAFSVNPYLDALSDGSDDSRYFAISTLVMHASTPDALRDHVLICCFIEGEGTPPDAPVYFTGYCIGDVLEGRTDWNPDEVDELRSFVMHEPRFTQWLQGQFDAIDSKIRNNPVWNSPLGIESDEIDVPAIKRAVIIKSATDPNAMSQLHTRR